MARALAQILKEISASYNPQRDVLNKQIGTLDPQMQAEQTGLESAKRDAFQQITDQSNRRGLLFSGIPISEQAGYTGSSFLPAVANLKAKYAQQRFNLQDALAGLDTSAYKDAYGVYEQELSRDAAAARAGGGGASPSFGGASVLGAETSGASAPNVSYQQKANGGFAFYDASGRPISAAQYSVASGIPFRTLLQQMAASGDGGAKSALGFVGNDYGYNPNAVNNQSVANLYNSLVWGTGRQARVYNPKPAAAPAGGSNFTSNQGRPLYKSLIGAFSR